MAGVLFLSKNKEIDEIIKRGKQLLLQNLKFRYLQNTTIEDLDASGVTKADIRQYTFGKFNRDVQRGPMGERETLFRND